AEEWLVRFHFRHRYCTDSEYVFANVITYEDTHSRAAWNTTDFALVELQNDILRDVFSVGQKVWLGWYMTGNTPTNGTYIHHPSGYLMMYAYNEDAFPETNSGSTSSCQNYWYCQIGQGTLERASSGSPVFNQNSRASGQFRAGYPGCSSSN